MVDFKGYRIAGKQLLVNYLCLSLFQDVRMVDPNFIKIFKLAQLSIEYLLVSSFFDLENIGMSLLNYVYAHEIKSFTNILFIRVAGFANESMYQ